MSIDYKSYVYGTFCQNAFIQIPKWSIHAMGGVEPATLLAEMLSFYRCLDEKGDLMTLGQHGNGWMYFTQEKCQNDLLIGPIPFRKYRKTFVEIGLLESVTHGLPSKNYYRFNMKALAEWKQRSEWEFSRNVSRCIDSMHLGTSNRCILQHRIDASPIYIQQEIQEEKNNTTGADAPAADAAPCDVLNPSVSAGFPNSCRNGHCSPSVNETTPTHHPIKDDAAKGRLNAKSGVSEPSPSNMQLAKDIIQALSDHNPHYTPAAPKPIAISLAKLVKGNTTAADVLEVVHWALSHEIWSGVLYKKRNVGAYLVEKFCQLHTQMNAKPTKKQGYGSQKELKEVTRRWKEVLPQLTPEEDQAESDLATKLYEDYIKQEKENEASK